MAQRRMFSKKIVETDFFMEMSPTAKLLYFYLNMSADDDGAYILKENEPSTRS